MGAVKKGVHLASNMTTKRSIPAMAQIGYKVHALLHGVLSSPAVVKTYQTKEMMS